MAEAAVDQHPLKFFCHQCSVEIHPNIPEYTCPRCQSGFIEEIENADSPDSQEMPPDPAAQFAELWGRAFQDMLQIPPNSSQGSNPDNSNVGEEGMDSTSSDSGTNTHPSTRTRLRHVHPVFPPGARIAIRRRPGQQHNPNAQYQQFQSLLEQLLTGITGQRGVQQGGAMPGGFPFGPMIQMHGNPGDYAWGSAGLDNIISQLLNQLEGSGPPPAEKGQIDDLPTVQVTKEDVEKNVQCSVCMEDFTEAEEVKQLPCQHKYHDDCIVPWLKLHGTCPVCRKNMAGEDTSDGSHQDQDPASSGSDTYTDPSSYFRFDEEYD